jgi:hypothetical protein
LFLKTQTPAYFYFLIEKFSGISVLGFYQVRIIPVLRSIFAVLGIYQEWRTDLISAMMAKLITDAQLKRAESA